MAKSQYSGDSPFPSSFSEHPGMSRDSETSPVKPAPFLALPVIAAPSMSMPPPYVLSGAAMYIGESMDCSRRLRGHDAADATPYPNGAFPSSTSTID